MKKTILTTAILLILGGCGGAEEEAPKSTGTKPPAATTPISVSLNRVAIDIKEGDSTSQTQKLIIDANRNVDENVTITVKSEDGSAKAGVDFILVDTTVTIPKGSRNAELIVSSIGNTIHQSDRNFTVSITDVKMGTTSLEKGASTASFKILDDDPEPILQFSSEKFSAHEDIGSLNIPITFDRMSDKVTTLRFTVAGIALQGADYVIDPMEVKIPPLTQVFNLPVRIIKDQIIEGSETIDITMNFVSNAKIGQKKLTSVLISGDLRLPDTGVTTFVNNGSFLSSSPDSLHPYQDAQYGLDVDPRFKGNGRAGFVYQKIDMAGNPLSYDSPHKCVYDTHTGLTWELKSEYTEIPVYGSQYEKENHADHLWNNASHRYLWRNLNAKNNGGSAGGVNEKEFPDQELPISENCAFPSKLSPLWMNMKPTGCVADKFVELTNKAAICGFSDWRLPSALELTTLVSYQTNSSLLDEWFFNESARTEDVKYLSSTPSVDNTASVWCLNAKNKIIELCNKQVYHHLRLVRGPKL